MSISKAEATRRLADFFNHKAEGIEDGLVPLVGKEDARTFRTSLEKHLFDKHGKQVIVVAHRFLCGIEYSVYERFPEEVASFVKGYLAEKDPSKKAVLLENWAEFASMRRSSYQPTVISGYATPEDYAHRRQTNSFECIKHDKLCTPEFYETLLYQDANAEVGVDMREGEPARKVVQTNGTHKQVIRLHPDGNEEDVTNEDEGEVIAIDTSARPKINGGKRR